MCPAPCSNRAWRLQVTRPMGIMFWLLIGRDKHFVDGAANQWKIKTYVFSCSFCNPALCTHSCVSINCVAKKTILSIVYEGHKLLIKQIIQCPFFLYQINVCYEDFLPLTSFLFWHDSLYCGWWLQKTSCDIHLHI